MTSATDLAQARTYLDSLDRLHRAEEAEGRAFASYMTEPTEGRAGTARKAKSRTNALASISYEAEGHIWRIMDALDQRGARHPEAVRAAIAQADPERLARAIIDQAGR